MSGVEMLRSEWSKSYYNKLIVLDQVVGAGRKKPSWNSWREDNTLKTGRKQKGLFQMKMRSWREKSLEISLANGMFFSLLSWRQEKRHENNATNTRNELTRFGTISLPHFHSRTRNTHTPYLSSCYFFLNMESQNINTNMNNNNIDDNSTLGNTVAVPASLLPPYRQGEDQSFAHVESPSAVARVEVLLSSWKQKLDGIANQAIETMKVGGEGTS